MLKVPGSELGYAFIWVIKVKVCSVLLFKDNNSHELNSGRINLLLRSS